MVDHHSCLLGPMRLIDEIWQTNNTADLAPQWPIVGLTWKKSSSENCYAYPSEVHARFDEGVHSSVGDVRHCRYSDGKCPLPEQAFMIWTPDWRQKCKYIFMKEWSGHRLEDVWAADSEEFALTFSSSSEVVEDCGKMLAVTTRIRRHRRDCIHGQKHEVSEDALNSQQANGWKPLLVSACSTVDVS